MKKAESSVIWIIVVVVLISAVFLFKNFGAIFVANQSGINIDIDAPKTVLSLNESFTPEVGVILSKSESIYKPEVNGIAFYFVDDVLFRKVGWGERCVGTRGTFEALVLHDKSIQIQEDQGAHEFKVVAIQMNFDSCSNFVPISVAWAETCENHISGDIGVDTYNDLSPLIYSCEQVRDVKEKSTQFYVEGGEVINNQKSFFEKIFDSIKSFLNAIFARFNINFT